MAPGSQNGNCDHSDRLLRTRSVWDRDPPLKQSLPISFPSGSVLEHLNCRCPKCAQPIQAEKLRGRATRVSPDIATFEALGACLACQLLIPFSFRVRGTETLRMEWRHPIHGWVYSDFASTSGPVARGWRRLRRLVGFGPSVRSAGLVAALTASCRSGKDMVAADLLRCGWATALEAELTYRGLRNLRPHSSEGTSIILRSDDGSMVRLGMGMLCIRPDLPEEHTPRIGGELGPTRWEILSNVDQRAVSDVETDGVEWSDDQISPIDANATEPAVGSPPGCR